MVYVTGIFARKPSIPLMASINIIGSVFGPSTSNKTQKLPFVTYTILGTAVRCLMLSRLSVRKRRTYSCVLTRSARFSTAS